MTQSKDHEADLDPATLAIHAGRPVRRPDGPLNTPVYFSSTYHAGGPVGYGRDGNPTWSAFEEAMGALEGGSAVAFASGMGAATAVLEGLSLGSTVVVPSSSYIGTREFLSEGGKRARFQVREVDVTNTEETISACKGADLLWIESPSNPLLGIADISSLCGRAHALAVRVAVDNTFATPLLQRPLDLGADVVVHSATKLLSGHSDVLMGVVVTRSQDVVSQLRHHRELYGTIPGPMEAFLALRGLRTLSVRLERAQRNAGELAQRLKAHPRVSKVRYPGLAEDPGHERALRQMKGFGAMVSFEVRGGAEAAEKVCGAVRLLTHGTSLGGIETLIERRHKWRGEERTPPELLRMSVGCEDVDDLWRDLDCALAASIS